MMWNRLRATAMALLTVAGFVAITAQAAEQRRDGEVAAAGERPNIIFIFTDDHATHAIGAYGGWLAEHAPTPNLDRLAREGMLFRNCFVTNSICGPSRAVILTGKHNHLNGFTSNGRTFDGSQLTFPKLLRKAGYETALIGKWHLKSDPTGFDHWSVLTASGGQGTYYNPEFKSSDKGTYTTEGYTTDIITDQTLAWLENQRDSNKPFMLMFQHKAPHREWAPGPDHLNMYDDVTLPEPPTLFDDYEGRASPAADNEMSIADHMQPGQDLKIDWAHPNLTPAQREKFLAAYADENAAMKQTNLQGKDLVRWKYQRYIKDYLRCVASVDDNVGRLLAYLKKTGLDKNTIVIYSSDQGFYLGDHGWYDKRWMYEESLRMPLIVRWPGVTRPGSENTHLVQNLDFAETFLDMAGVEAPSEMQGESIVPLLAGENPDDWRKSLYYHYYEYPRPHRVQKHYGVRTHRYKLIHYYPVDEWELFDLKEDPDELNSVYGDAAYAKVQKRLKAELKRLQAYYGDTNPTVEPPSRAEKLARAAMQKVKLQQVFAAPTPDADVPRRPDCSGKPITVGAVVTAKANRGVIVAQGGASLGYVLSLRDGRPAFAIRNRGKLREVVAEAPVSLNKPVHIAGVLDKDLNLRLYVDGREVAQSEGIVIESNPNDELALGRDTGSRVGNYDQDNALQGDLREIRLYWGVLPAKQMAAWAGR